MLVCKAEAVHSEIRIAIGGTSDEVKQQLLQLIGFADYCTPVL